MPCVLNCDESENKSAKAAVDYIKKVKVCIRGVLVDYICIIKYWESQLSSNSFSNL